MPNSQPNFAGSRLGNRHATNGPGAISPSGDSDAQEARRAPTAVRTLVANGLRRSLTPWLT